MRLVPGIYVRYLNDEAAARPDLQRELEVKVLGKDKDTYVDCAS